MDLKLPLRRPAIPAAELVEATRRQTEAMQAEIARSRSLVADSLKILGGIQALRGRQS